MNRSLGLTHRLPQPDEGGWIEIVAVDIAQELRQMAERFLIRPAAVLFQTGVGALAQLLHAPAGLGDADDRDIQPALANHALQGREDLLVGKIPGGSEEDQGIGGIR